LRTKNTKINIGRIEKIDLPELSIQNLDAKIDTGAYTSSLHCHKIRTEVIDDKLWVHFFVLDPEHPEYEATPFRSPVHTIRYVKSSNGIVQERVTIKTRAKFFGRDRTIELSLADRSEMKYPVLIGRKFLTGKYIVDVSKIYLSQSEETNP
jgi:hypothetical protein